MTWRATLLVAALAATAAPTLVHAQTPDNNGNGNNNDNNGGRRNRGGNGGDNNGGGGGGGRRNFDPAQMQQRVMDALKEQMNPADDEWKVIEPKLTKLLEAQRDVQNGAGNVMRLAFGGGRGGPGGGGPGGGGQGGQGGGGNRGGPGGGGPGGGPPSNTELGRAATDLHTATEADGTSPEDLEKKVTAFRTARTNATTKLEGARKDLKDVLTPKQEAVLLYYGLLE